MALDISQFLSLSYLVYVLISSVLAMIAVYAGVKIAHEATLLSRAFFVAFLANIINLFGVVGIISSLIPVPSSYQILSTYNLVYYAVSILVWILLIRFFYYPMRISHTIVIALVAFGLVEIFNFLGLANMIRASIPL